MKVIRINKLSSVVCRKNRLCESRGRRKWQTGTPPKWTESDRKDDSDNKILQNMYHIVSDIKQYFWTPENSKNIYLFWIEAGNNCICPSIMNVALLTVPYIIIYRLNLRYSWISKHCLLSSVTGCKLSLYVVDNTCVCLYSVKHDTCVCFNQYRNKRPA